MDIAYKRSDDMLNKMDKRIQKVYKQAAKETEQKVKDYYAKYQTKYAAKLKDMKSGKITKKEFAEWNKGQVMIGKRWEEMRDTIATDLHNSNKIAASIANGYLPEAYALNHNYGTFEVEKGSLINTSYTMYDKQTVERLIRDNPRLLPKLDPSKEKDVRWNKQRFNNGILQGILQGESIDKIARRVALGTSHSDYVIALRNARTAMTGAQNAGRYDSYVRAAEMGINVIKVWQAALDSHTRDSHRDMDGEEVPYNEEFSNKLMYPGDPDGDGAEVYNCRCTMYAEIDKSSDTGGAGNVDERLGDMSYEEWEGTQNTPTPSIPRAIYDSVTITKASEDWFEYEKANYMREYVKTGKIAKKNMYGGSVSAKEGQTLAAEAELIQNAGVNNKTKYKTLYRGMVMDEDEVRATFTPGESFRFETLSAATPDKKIAKMYADVENAGGDGVPVILEIQKPDGIYGFKRDDIETVLPKGGEFNVSRNYMDKDGVVHVSLYSKRGNNIRGGK